uniref:Uncharacterized protein n=1 Tax=Pseudomonas fluorescens (strain SBW25) TaxID=216595 RepID=A0A0G4E511_PSEFS|nr:hypothetical protein PQBR57_0362 [Pseudomonas fluorescens SBW25]
MEPQGRNPNKLGKLAPGVSSQDALVWERELCLLPGLP